MPQSIPPGYSVNSGIGLSITTTADSLRDNFHVYAIEWEADEIRWYFDDQQYFKVAAEDALGEWVFDHPFFIILNVAVGSRWPGYPDETTVLPQFLMWIMPASTKSLNAHLIYLRFKAAIIFHNEQASPQTTLLNPFPAET